GGTSLFLPGNEVGLGWRETLADFSRTMSRYVDAMVFRVFHHATLDGIAAHATVPIVNGLSDRSHPCQGLADMLTIREHCGGFAGFQVNANLLSAAKPECKVLHCLPAHRGEEITDEVLDGPQSAAFDQAENRLHAQKAVLEWLMK